MGKSKRIPRWTIHPNQRTDKVGFRLGLGTHYYSEAYFLEVFAPFNLSQKGFRCWCRALGVPLIFIGRHAVINLRKFEIALEAVSHIGQPDFLVPGCDYHPAQTPLYTNRLSPEYVAANYHTFVSELLLAYTKPGKPPADLIDHAFDVARHWALNEILHLPQEAQSRFTDEAIALGKRMLPLTPPRKRNYTSRAIHERARPYIGLRPVNDPDADAAPPNP